MKIIIIDNNKGFIDKVISSIKKHEFDYAYNGEEALNKIKYSKYDLIIIDLVLPIYDGIYLLENIKKLNIDSKIIISTAHTCENILLKLNNYNVDEILIKPYSLEYLDEKISYVFSCSKRYNILNMLYEFGISRNLRGYKYIEECIGIISENNDQYIKNVYQKVSAKYNTNIYNVERDIRNAIEIGSRKGNIDYYSKIFGYTIDYNKGKPTNKQFLFTLYEYISNYYSNKML